MEVINALGRRKTAVARIYMKAGSGNITVNKRDYKEYFPTSILHYVVEQPMMLTETLGQIRHQGQPRRWWHQRPGRGFASRHQPRPLRDQPRVSSHPEG